MIFQLEVQCPYFDICGRSNIAVFEPAEFKEAERDERWIEAMKDELKMIEKNDTWEMIDLGLMAWFLGMEVKQDEHVVSINQKKYAKEILKKFHMEDCKSTSTPMNQKE